MNTDYKMVIDRHGGPEVLRQAPLDLAGLADDEVLIVQEAIGLNFVDIYHRAGQFGVHEPIPLPATLGVQGAGRVEAVGDKVTRVKAGDRVGYVGYRGAYASRRVIPESKLVPLPDDMSSELAAACLVRGLTAEYLLFQLYAVQPGDTVVIHAAAGGVGSIASQWATALGATVIGTVGSAAKAERAKAAGCAHVVVYTDADWADQVLAITAGAGVPVVYDSIGRDTFLESLRCLRIRGLAINYGTTSGQVENFPLQLLHSRSLSVCRPTLPNFIADTVAYDRAANRFFAALRDGTITIEMGPAYALKDVAQAHSDFEQRRIVGMPILLP